VTVRFEAITPFAGHRGLANGVIVLLLLSDADLRNRNAVIDSDAQIFIGIFLQFVGGDGHCQQIVAGYVSVVAERGVDREVPVDLRAVVRKVDFGVEIGTGRNKCNLDGTGILDSKDI